MGRWVNESEAGRQELVSPLAAAEELPLNFAGSVVSSVTSCLGISVSSVLRKLQKCATRRIWKKEIAYKQKEMSQITDKIYMKLDSTEELEPGFLAVIESALDQRDDLAQEAIRRLDKL